MDKTRYIVYHWINHPNKLPKESFLVKEPVGKEAAEYHILLNPEEIISLSKEYDVMICNRQYCRYPMIFLDDIDGKFRVR